jgi:osmotically-inducible protein OsmY
MKQLAENEVRQVTGVQGVMNELEIIGNSSLTSRSSDALITAKVSASFVAEKGLNANSIQIVTERGNVYLLGLVTEHEGRVAAEVTSGVSGVQRVIKMFEYISEDQLKSMNSVQGARS